MRNSNLCRPRIAYMKPRQTLRIRRLWVDYVGGFAGLAIWGRILPLAVLLCILPTVVLWNVDETPYWLDSAWGAMLLSVVANQVMVGKGFAEGMMELHINERGLYYRPEVVTGHYSTWIPKLLAEHRVEDWRDTTARPLP